MKSVKITIDGESHVNVKETDKRVHICSKCSLAAECLDVSTGGFLCDSLGLEGDEYFEKEKTKQRLDELLLDEYAYSEPEE